MTIIVSISLASMLGFLILLQILNTADAQLTSNDGASSIIESLQRAKEKIEKLKETLSEDTTTGANLTESYTSPGLGIKIAYPPQWMIAVTNDFEDCSLDNHCWFNIWGPIDHYLEPSISFSAYSLKKPTNYSPECSCKNLTEFVRWEYKYDATNPRKTYLNDNITTIDENHTAWQMETYDRVSTQNYTDWSHATGKDTIVERSLSLWAVDNGLGYKIVYYAPQDIYHKYLPDFLRIVRSISFISHPYGPTSESTVPLPEQSLPIPR